MKNIFVVFIVLGLSLSLFAQEQTLLGDGEIEHGGFGGPVIKFGSVNDEFGVFVGGRGGWIINHSLVIGGGGYGLVNDIPIGQTIAGEETYLQMGYGGVELEYIFASDDVLHLTAYVLFGAGGVNYRRKDFDDWGDFDDSDSFFVAEPALNLELNIIRYLRLQVGGSYRFINGVDSFGLKDSDLAGPSAHLTFKFGEF